MNKELAKDFFSCKNISIDLGGREILRNINIDIKPGEVLGIIGPNGAGKTSLIEIPVSYTHLTLPTILLV